VCIIVSAFSDIIVLPITGIIIDIVSLYYSLYCGYSSIWPIDDSICDICIVYINVLRLVLFIDIISMPIYLLLLVLIFWYNTFIIVWYYSIICLIFDIVLCVCVTDNQAI